MASDNTIHSAQACPTPTQAAAKTPTQHIPALGWWWWRVVVWGGGGCGGGGGGGGGVDGGRRWCGCGCAAGDSMRVAAVGRVEWVGAREVVGCGCWSGCWLLLSCCVRWCRCCRKRCCWRCACLCWCCWRYACYAHSFCCLRQCDPCWCWALHLPQLELHPPTVLSRHSFGEEVELRARR